MRSVALLILLSFSVCAFAEPQFWVSVGSFKASENAERALQSATTQISEPISVIGADTPAGYYYRVAVGPYSSRDRANSDSDVLLSGLATQNLLTVDKTEVILKRSHLFNEQSI